MSFIIEIKEEACPAEFYGPFRTIKNAQIKLLKDGYVVKSENKFEKSDCHRKKTATIHHLWSY